MPLLVIQGEEDDDGLHNDSLDLVEATTTVPADAGRHAYTHTTITTPDGTSVVESKGSP